MNAVTVAPPVVYVQRATPTDAADWLIRQYEHVLDVPHLVAQVRRRTSNLDSQRFALGICLKHAVLDMLHAEPRDPWRDEADAALVGKVDWSCAAALVLVRYSQAVLASLQYAAIDACELSARMSEVEAELADEELHNYRPFSASSDFDAPLDYADVPESAFA